MIRIPYGTGFKSGIGEYGNDGIGLIKAVLAGAGSTGGLAGSRHRWRRDAS
jgi:hypothetical protein